MPAQRRLPRAARPDRIAAEYLRALGPQVRALQEILAEFVRNLEKQWPKPEPERADNDQDIRRLVKRTADKLGKAIKAQSIVPIATKYGEATSEFQRAQLAKQARTAVSIDLRKLGGIDRKIPQQVQRTARDNRVREEHEALEGESFAWSDPPSEGHPGEPVNCRCYADPDFSELLG